MIIKYAKEIAHSHKSGKIVLIASRRTDMPRFYIDEIFTGLQRGIFHPQGLMQPIWELRFQPEDIHSIGLWSQDYSQWLKKRSNFTEKYYHFWYRFTILPDNPLLKPKAPPLAEQLEQLEQLVELDGNRCINVCIDPIAQYTPIGKLSWTYNYTENEIAKIFNMLLKLHISSCTISIIDYYKKVAQRANRYGVIFNYPDEKTDEGKQHIVSMITPIKSLADNYGIELRSCCENFLAATGLTKPGSCVDGALLNGLFGPGASTKSDQGQRKKYGCACTQAVDIGRYTNHGPWSHQCFHDCPQCYARR